MLENEEIKKILSKNIKNARTKVNITQDMLSEKVNISTQFLRDIEAGRKTGSLSTLINICLALNITPNELFYDIFENNIKENKNLALKVSLLSERDQKIINATINEMLEGKE